MAEFEDDDGNPYAPPPLSEDVCDVETLQDLHEQWGRCVEALVEATVVVGIVGMLVALLLPAVNASHHPGPTPVWLVGVLGVGICTPPVWWGLRFFRYHKVFVALSREMRLERSRN